MLEDLGVGSPGRARLESSSASESFVGKADLKNTSSMAGRPVRGTTGSWIDLSCCLCPTHSGGSTERSTAEGGATGETHLRCQVSLLEMRPVGYLLSLIDP